MPSWYAVLQIAHKWGQLPHIVAPGTSPLKWFYRERFITNTENKVAAKKQHGR